MVQIRFYIDEDAMRSSFVNALRSSGLDIVTVAEVDLLGYSDAKHLAWATEQGRVLYSFNVKDFSCLHNQLLAQGNSHTGIVVVPGSATQSVSNYGESSISQTASQPRK